MKLFPLIVAVKFFLNKLDRLKPDNPKELCLDMKEASGKDIEGNEVVVHPSQENIQSMSREGNVKCVENLVSKNSKSSLGEKPSPNVGLRESCKSNIGFLPTIDDKSMPVVKANGNEYCNASLVKQISSNEKQCTSVDGLERKSAKEYDRSKAIFGEKNVLRSQIDERGGKPMANGGSNRQDVEGDEKTHVTHGLVEDKNGKKIKPDDFKSNLNAKRAGAGVHRRRLVHGDDDDKDNVEALVLDVTSLKDKHKLRLEKDSSDAEATPSKRLKLNDNPTKLSHDQLHKESSAKSPKGDQKIDSFECKVAQRPDAVSSFARAFTLCRSYSLLYHALSIHNQLFWIDSQNVAYLVGY